MKITNEEIKTKFELYSSEGLKQIYEIHESEILKGKNGTESYNYFIEANKIIEKILLNRKTNI
jgi:hypothetical protein